jgi:hypothetical protein
MPVALYRRHRQNCKDRRAEDEHHEIERQEKALADYRAQLGRPFEHEGRLKGSPCETGAA